MAGASDFEDPEGGCDWFSVNNADGVQLFYGELVDVAYNLPAVRRFFQDLFRACVAGPEQEE